MVTCGGILEALLGFNNGYKKQPVALEEYYARYW